VAWFSLSFLVLPHLVFSFNSSSECSSNLDLIFFPPFLPSSLPGGRDERGVG
jgi:hypothetical protein